MCLCFKWILACLIPPLAVLADQGCTCELCLNLLLTFLGYFPGCIHAFCVVCREKPRYVFDTHHTVVNVNQAPAPPPIIIQPANHPMQQPFTYRSNQPYSPEMVGHMPYPMPPRQEMSGPPPYENGSDVGNQYTYKE